LSLTSILFNYFTIYVIVSLDQGLAKDCI